MRYLLKMTEKFKDEIFLKDGAKFVKINQALRDAQKKKLAYRFERTWKLFNADELANVLCVSRSKAYRIIKSPESLNQRDRKILDQHIQLSFRYQKR